MGDIFIQPAKSRGNDKYTKILLPFDGADGATSVTDLARGADTPASWTFGGNAQLDTGIAPNFGSASLLCDGTGDYITAPDNALFSLGGGDFTVDFWFNRQGGNGTRRFIYGQMNSAGTAGSAFAELFNTGNVLRCGVFKSNVQTVVLGTTAVTATGWNHGAFVRTGDTLKMFLNGTQEGGDVAFTGSVDDNSNDFSIGRPGELTTLAWNGLIDEFRLSVGIARWTANFTPPTRAYGPV